MHEKTSNLTPPVALATHQMLRTVNLEFVSVLPG